MMTHSLSLESFEDGLAETAATSLAFEQGYQAGLDAGIASTSANQAALDEVFVQNLNQIDFTYAEARGQLLGALAPLLSIIVAKVLPHCVATGFADQLADELRKAAARDTAATITLHVHPSQRIAVEEATKKTTTKLLICEDPSLNKHAAWIKQEQNETLLDVDDLLAAISEALGAIQHPENRTESHG